MMVGAALWLNQFAFGPWIVVTGFAVLLVMLFGWFGTVIGESERGLFNLKVDASFRWAMSWFIFSEVMFFAVFFGTLFYARVLVVPWLAGEGDNFFTNFLLWPGFENAWPSTGPAGEDVERMGAWGLPAAQHGDPAAVGRHDHDRAPRAARGSSHAAHHLARGDVPARLLVPRLPSRGIHPRLYASSTCGSTRGIYGGTFFMLTGFHGLHVTLGAVMLLIIWLRVLRGHFKPDRHFAFEAVAWYWHFVDVVWLGLFFFVYWI